MPDEGWQPLLDQYLLPDRAIHVVCAHLDRKDEEFSRFRDMLSAGETARSDRFHFDRDKKRFIVGRGILRTLIGRYLQIDPASVTFEYGSYGKPRLARSMEAPDFRFNLAHSQAIALFAFGRRRELGVDVEYNRPLSDADRIAERYFSPNEVKRFRGLPQYQKLEAFYNCWTRKEAFIKAIGDGLSYPLDQFDVTFAPGEEAGLLSLAGDATEAQKWSIRALHPGTGFTAALVVRARGWSFSCWRWPD